jgi:anhydro-N-acetylmuramic acid kinase
MKLKNTYTAIGLMSGTSLDGLDVALCTYTKRNKDWDYKIQDAKTYPYDRILRQRLINTPIFYAEDFWKIHVDFGKFSAQIIHTFLKGKKYKVDVIASHGHTVFHQPQNRFTCQIGDGATIAALTNITTVCNFRSTDVALGGQGAPLVPIGDELLFSKYDACLNIGGITNISFKNKKERIAFDVCPANLVFNFYAAQAGKPYDKGGVIAASGKVNEDVLKKLNTLSFYRKYKSKSLGREWVDEEIIALLEDDNMILPDKMATALEHSAFQAAAVLNHFKLKNVLITGGGAYNTHFINRIKHHTVCQLILPDNKTIQFKEALIFAFLGVLRLREEVNCLKSVTGAKRNSCSGALHLGT